MGDYNDAFMRNKDAAVQARTKAQNRSNVLQLKLIGQSHPTGLTTSLLKLFEARSPLEFKSPIEKRKPLPYAGMAQFVNHFAEPGDPEYAPAIKEAETPKERRARIQKIRLEKGAVKAAEELLKYDPHKDPNATGDPYKTLFVARLNYETTEHRIKREFEAYGPIKRARLVTDIETEKPRGYAFVEYMHTRDMKSAYKQADGRKLDNRRVLVDVERGRTVPNWRPRRLGGGLGSTRIGGGTLIKRILEGSCSKLHLEVIVDLKNQEHVKNVMLIETGRSPEKEEERGILRGRSLEIEIQGKIGITIETERGLGIGTEREIAVGVTAIVVEAGTGIETGTALVIATGTTSVLATSVTVGTHRRRMATMTKSIRCSWIEKGPVSEIGILSPVSTSMEENITTRSLGSTSTMIIPSHTILSRTNTAGVV